MAIRRALAQMRDTYSLMHLNPCKQFAANTTRSGESASQHPLLTAQQGSKGGDGGEKELSKVTQLATNDFTPSDSHMDEISRSWKVTTLRASSTSGIPQSATGSLERMAFNMSGYFPTCWSAIAINENERVVWCPYRCLFIWGLKFVTLARRRT